ncbi:tRNA(Ile)(2)-agmatinylcytidine synthase [Candidatus Bathyarchaeota archaeon]|nr:tRNA(Ile)(2)-agmatinylcytidine synthase [Candidatus Bathyarchaeota archaeon]
MVKLHIGFDDTDSPECGCTTYIAALLVEKLNEMDINFIDYPNLIRLNPNVPWKTRGNGALCIRLICPENKIDTIKKTVINLVEKNSDLGYDGTDPGIVLMEGEIPQEVKKFAKKAEQTIVTIKASLKLAKKINANTIGFKKGRGIIGGLAAIGEELKEDHTFEIISYRTAENRNKPRRINASSVKTMDAKSQLTFNNIDYETGRILITPRGPDPILCGIRGETPEAVKQAFREVKIDETIERWMIFRSNQGTDAHLKNVSKVKDIQPYNPVIVNGVVGKVPHIIKGGHVIFAIKDNTGEVDCAAYEPTLILSKITRKLIPGDVLTVYGGVRPMTSDKNCTINLEKVKIQELVPKQLFINPICPDCNRRLKSMGKNQGFRCDKCGFHSIKIGKTEITKQREIELGLYITTPRSQRHLTKPHFRYGKEKNSASKEMIKKWHYP